MAKKICKSHITALGKVHSQLRMHQKMNYGQLILGIKNELKVKQAEQLISEAMKILETVE